MLLTGHGASCPLRVALRRSWSGCHVNMAKIDWPDFHTDGLIVIWRKDEELIALPIRNGRVGFGIHELQGQGASLLQQRGFTEKDTMTLKKMLESNLSSNNKKIPEKKQVHNRSGSSAGEININTHNAAVSDKQSDEKFVGLAAVAEVAALATTVVHDTQSLHRFLPADQHEAAEDNLSFQTKLTCSPKNETSDANNYAIQSVSKDSSLNSVRLYRTLVDENCTRAKRKAHREQISLGNQEKGCSSHHAA
ncbi:hypothetical protein EB796_015757 [Bugula neritina]|uniref:Uncharacterized protein n=1 Tax=Bugula neritina TaxID=10212 RepID=A0A7J7JK08_BUGNE|nr:hypothetical protein EB796_015757 [Bugula neritina]